MRFVVITRPRHPLHGQALAEVGRMRRHARLELLLVLPDGSKSLIPAAWTDHGEDTPTAVADAVAVTVATLGSLSDLLAARALVADLANTEASARGQAARTSPCKEGPDAAWPAQFAPRPPPQASGGVGRGATDRSGRRGDHAAGRGDRQGQRPGRERGDQR